MTDCGADTPADTPFLGVAACGCQAATRSSAADGPLSAQVDAATGPEEAASHTTEQFELAERYNARGRGRRLLLKGACIVTLDRAVGDFACADILVEDDRIVAVGPDIDADALVVEAAGKIVFPGFVDTHRHCWQSLFRRFAPNILWQDYRKSSDRFANVYRPSDVYLGGLLSALGALHSGVTTMLDWSHISNTPEHSDAAIAGLRACGIRGIYGYGQARSGWLASQYPHDITRIRKQHFSSDDQLVKLCLAADIERHQHWHLARELDLPITAHAARHPELIHEIHRKGLMGPDVTYIHCTALDDIAWRHIADSGGSISLAVMSVAQLGVAGGVPPIQKALDLGIRPSLSIDVEVSLPGDMFSQMRVVLSLQRSGANDRRMRGEPAAPPLLTARDVLEFATVEGARTLGMLDRIGTLSPGKQADFVVLDAEDFNTMPLNNAVGTIVSGADAGNVEGVVVAGTIRKWDRRLVGVDKRALLKRVTAARTWLAEQAGLPIDLLGDGG
jgi:cytosine/adenosine deaminase-related metal-dependent hydrolase